MLAKVRSRLGWTIVAVAAFGLVLGAGGLTKAAQAAPGTGPAASPSADDVLTKFRKVTDGVFIPNEGQFAPETEFKSGTPGNEVWFAQSRMRFFMAESGATVLNGPLDVPPPPDPDVGPTGLTHTIEVTFEGANDEVDIAGENEQSGVFNYLVGDTNVTGVHPYGAIQYNQLWDGIDLRFSGNRDPSGVVKSVFVVKPDANPDLIQLKYAGQNKISLDEKGNLVVETPLGNIVEAAPIAYTESGEWVNVGYRLRGDTVSFQVDTYDTSEALYIDPSLIYSKQFGSSLYEYTTNAMLESATSRYIAGLTYNTSGGSEWQNKPGGGAQPGHAGGSYDWYLIKFNLANSVWEAFTFIGGTSTDYGSELAWAGSDILDRRHHLLVQRQLRRRHAQRAHQHDGADDARAAVVRLDSDHQHEPGHALLRRHLDDVFGRAGL